MLFLLFFGYSFDMWSCEDIIDVARGIFPLYLVFVFPLLIIISPLPVTGSVEFPVFRLQQFELHGTTYGSQSSLVNVEARTLNSGYVTRKCVIARILSLTPAVYQRLIDEGAAAILILLPSSLAKLSSEHKKLIWELEEAIVDSDVQSAVYLAYENYELTQIYESVGNSMGSDKAGSAAAALLSSLSSDGYQMVVSGSQSKRIQDSSIANIYGRLSGHGVEEQLPTIVVVAHYDAFAAAPNLAFGADSNGSGLVALLEIARIFSKLYSSPRTHPKMNLVFLLSGGGFVNYQGSKRFLEDQLDASDSPLLSELHFALCLDTIANGQSLNLHVSKKPKEDTPGHSFWKSVEKAGKDQGVPVDMVHKKINLQDDKQSWEHEKFSIRRLPAFTISRLNNSTSGERGSLTDTYDTLNVRALTSHVSVIISGLLGHVYGNPVDDTLLKGLSVTEDSIKAWASLLSTQPRSPQLLAGKSNSLVSSLHQILMRYTSEVKISLHKSDARDPEWVFYDATKSTMAAYAVKPAFFDFLLTLVIIAYLGIFYMVLIYFPKCYSMLYKFFTTSPTSVKSKFH